VFADRGVTPVSYADWLQVSAAEEELAAALGRGERVKLPDSDAIWSAARRLSPVWHLPAACRHP
jgi:ferredoxin--NADP+ reductase